MNIQDENWYELNNPGQLDSPAMLVYPDRVQHNIDHVIKMVKDPGLLRPHVKTSKSIDTTKMMMRAGIRRFKCATIAEAEMLGMAGAIDVLIAYQPIGPRIARLLKLIEAYPETVFSCLLDHPAAAIELSAAAIEKDILVDYFIDIDAGMHRTGIPPGNVIPFFQEIRELKGIRFAGLHIYDGHIVDASLDARKTATRNALTDINSIVDTIGQLSGREPIIVAGGTPTFPIHRHWREAQCSPGTFIYWDYSYQQRYTEQPFLPAIVLFTRVIATPSPGIICIDLGHKAVASENELAKRVHFLNANGLVPVGHSEEHMMLSVIGTNNYKPGDILYALPYHVCPTVALHHQAEVVNNGELQGAWETTARNRKITI